MSFRQSEQREARKQRWRESVGNNRTNQQRARFDVSRRHLLEELGEDGEAERRVSRAYWCELDFGLAEAFPTAPAEHAARSPRRDKHRGLGSAPAHPDVSRCKLCGASVYVVSSQDGDDVTLDAESLDISGDGRSRMEYRMPSIRTVGGYRLHDPQLFYGWTDPSSEYEPGRVKPRKPEWQWFATRMSLSMAASGDVDLHAEHITTCSAVDIRTLAAKLSNVALTGSASGDHEQGRRTRRLRLEARKAAQEPQAAHDRLEAAFQESLPERVADEYGQLSLF